MHSSVFAGAGNSRRGVSALFWLAGGDRASDKPGARCLSPQVTAGPMFAGIVPSPLRSAPGNRTGSRGSQWYPWRKPQRRPAKQRRRLRAVKAGRLSATRNEAGSHTIDPAELDRVFPFITGDRTGAMKQVAPGSNGTGSVAGEERGSACCSPGAKRRSAISALGSTICAPGLTRSRLSDGN
jgi:hypothetical protein